MPRDIHPGLKVLPQARTGLDLAVEIFLTAKEASRCTARTVANYRWYLEKFQEWLQANSVSDAEGITAHHIRLFLAEVDKRGAAAGYTHTYAKIIKTWMRFLLA